MAYLNPVRITFAGQFQADPSTINNDVRHYDDAAFQSNFQDLETPVNPNGSWNPDGTGAFRLVGCRVTSVGYADGTTSTDAAEEPLIGQTVAGAGDRTAAKLVDLDPQWQLAPTPWGLGIRLLVGTDEVIRGEYANNPVRDLWFSRDPDQQGDAAASSTFQSVLTGVVLGAPDSLRSRALRELARSTTGERLSIRLTTSAYDPDSTSPTFTLGTLIGTIGPYLDAEPESFVLGRRFAPASGFTSYGANVTFFPALLHEKPRTLLLDLSNALQTTNGKGHPIDFGTLSVGVLKDDTVVENTPVTAENFMHLAEIDYRSTDWLTTTGGVVSVPLTKRQYDRAASHPLALAYDAPVSPGDNSQGEGRGVIAIRETTGGFLVGAEPMVLRLDPGQSAAVRLHAAQFGAPIRAEVSLRQLGRSPGQGGGEDSPQVDPIPIPDMGVPTAALELPATAKTDQGARPR